MKRPGGFDGAPDAPEPLEEPAAEGAERVFGLGAGVDPGFGEESAAAPRAAASYGVRLPTEGSGSVDRGAAAPRSGSWLEERLGRTGSAEVRTAANGDGPEGSVRGAARELRRARRAVRRRERREGRRFTAHGRRRRRYWLIAGAAIVALALFVAIGVLSPLMAVREVRVAGASRVDAEELLAALERFDGTPLALVTEQEVHRALEPFPLIQRYAVERLPPGTLVVRIEEREAVIAVREDDGFRLLDPAGVLVATEKKRPRGVPAARGAVTDASSSAFEAAAGIVRDLPEELRRRLTRVTASSDQDVEFTLRDGVVVFWGDAEDTQRKAVVLATMLEAVEQAARIDVSAPDAPVFE
ncbi:FtsQ-type POTRA domain-containing protein [Leucobacter weissii]|uniref:FtsQ-type POTRA domain-containing protein n=1 Tax=Leucobacter weissii TaxID=1983706 RepID=A0A939MP30_9MICO|nr:FtsQ-type POTRA domain-containing protein [Leucobacter weissii]